MLTRSEYSQMSTRDRRQEERNKRLAQEVSPDNTKDNSWTTRRLEFTLVLRDILSQNQLDTEFHESKNQAVSNNSPYREWKNQTVSYYTYNNNSAFIVETLMKLALEAHIPNPIPEKLTGTFLFGLDLSSSKDCPAYPLEVYNQVFKTIQGYKLLLPERIHLEVELSHVGIVVGSGIESFCDPGGLFKRQTLTNNVFLPLNPNYRASQPCFIYLNPTNAFVTGRDLTGVKDCIKGSIVVLPGYDSFNRQPGDVAFHLVTSNRVVPPKLDLLPVCTMYGGYLEDEDTFFTDCKNIVEWGKSAERGKNDMFWIPMEDQ
jgi:hypothetical protein